MNYKTITYPKPLGKTQGIGVTAPSSGLGRDVFIKRFERVAARLSEQGYSIVEGQCLRRNVKSVSAPRAARAEDLFNLWLNPQVEAIIPPWGGQVLIELLPQLDFDRFTRSPAKWMMGYSDTSTLLFAMTLKTGIATAHGINFMDLLPAQQDPLSRQALNALKLGHGDVLTQRSSAFHQQVFTDYRDDLDATYNLTEPTQWKSLEGVAELEISGRLIGGCIDVIGNLAGTEYGDLQKFKDTFCKEGTLVYLENCDLSPYALTRALWQMRLANWFEGAAGIIFGRNNGPDAQSDAELSYIDALRQCTEGLGIPIVYDADIGHKPPNMTLINGAYAKLSLRNGKATLTQQLV